MSQHPLVLGFHFLLELAALVSMGYWGWTQHAGIGRWLWTIGLPVAAAVAWALLRAPGDGPDPTIAIPAIGRLLLELAVLGGAAFLLWRAGQPLAADDQVRRSNLLDATGLVERVRRCRSAVAQCPSSYPLYLSVNRRP